MLDNLKKIIIDNYKKIDNKYKNIVSSNKLLSIMPRSMFLFIILAIFLTSLIFIVIDNQYDIVDQNTDMSKNVGALLTEGYEFNASSLSDNKIDKICFRVATYNRKNKAKYKYIVKKDNNIIYEKEFKTDSIDDGDYACFNASMIDMNEKDRYSIAIEPLYADSNNAITFFASSNMINYSSYIKKDFFNLNTVLILIFIILFFVINYFINNKKLKIEKIWLIYTIIYLLPLTLLVPPYEVPDEPAHFYAAYKFSQIDYSNYEKSKNSDYIISPSNLNCLNYSDFQNRDKVKDLDDIASCLSEGKNKRDYFYGEVKHVQTKIAYVFSSLGIFIADIFSNSPLIIFYAGRLFNLLGCSIIIFFALKIASKYKEVMLFIATIPMFVQQLCSYNYDSIVFAFGLLAFSIILDFIYNKNNNIKKYSVPLLISSIFISDIKFIYLLLFTMILFVPKDKFKKNYYKYLYIALIFGLSFIIGRITLMLASNNYVGLENNNLTYILNHPLYIFKLAFNTLNIKGWFYIRSLYGYFGWFQFRLSDTIIWIYLLFTLYIIIFNNRIKHSKLGIFIVSLSWLLCFAGVFAAMYFSWSSGDLDYIDGVQGRYFILMLFPLMYMLFSSKNKNSDKYENNVNIFTNISLLYYIILTIVMYY